MGFTVFALVKLYGQGLVTIGDFTLILGLSMETGHMTWFLMSEVDRFNKAVGNFNKAVGKCKQSLILLIIPLEIQDKADAAILNCTQGQSHSITSNSITKALNLFFGINS